MSKAAQLLALVMSIREEDGVGPLSLAPGAKVKFMMGDQEMQGEVCMSDDGTCYNQAEDAYCVKVGEEMHWVKSADLSVVAGESKKKTPAKPAPKTKKTEAEGGDPADTNGDGEISPEELKQKMMAECMGVKECYSRMKEHASQYAPKTMGLIESMETTVDTLMPTFESELSIPDADGGGAGEGGTEADRGQQ